MAPSPSDVALQKLSRVFGETRGKSLLDEAMTRAGLRTIQDADDLMKVARALEGLGGLERAVGAMLSVQAVMMGARD